MTLQVDKPTTIPVQAEKPLETVIGQYGSTKVELTDIPKQLPRNEAIEITEKKTRAPRGSKIPTTNGNSKKKVSVETMKESLEEQIKTLQEKVQLVEILKGLQAPEFPQDLTVPGKKLMIQLHQEWKQLLDKYAELINEM